MSVKKLIGKKLGMTRLFDENGKSIPVTILQAGPCVALQIKTIKTDGYNAVQMGFEDKKESHTSKSLLGHFSKAKISPKKKILEYRSDKEIQISLGDEIKVDIFKSGEKVDVSGTTKGKGFAGHMKRHGFSGGRKTHGKNSVMRKAGSIGSSASPSRVWPGTRMAGRMGNCKITVNNLTVFKVDAENNLLYLKGAVPGAKRGIVSITKN